MGTFCSLCFSALAKETRPKSADNEMVSVQVQILITDDLRGFTYDKREARRAYYGRKLKHKAADQGKVAATLSKRRTVRLYRSTALGVGCSAAFR
jgi:hypothetical protein